MNCNCFNNVNEPKLQLMNFILGNRICKSPKDAVVPFESQERVFGTRTALLGGLQIPLSKVPILFMKSELMKILLNF